MSEALRLADELQRVAKWSDSEHWDTVAQAAAELRRLHALNAELVQTLKRIAYNFDDKWHPRSVEKLMGDRARAALAKVEDSK